MIGSGGQHMGMKHSGDREHSVSLDDVLASLRDLRRDIEALLPRADAAILNLEKQSSLAAALPPQEPTYD